MPVTITVYGENTIHFSFSALAIDKVTGSFEVGKDLDAVVVDMKRNPSVDLLQDYSLQQLLQKFIYLGDDRNIAKVYVKGRLSVTKNEPWYGILPHVN